MIINYWLKKALCTVTLLTSATMSAQPPNCVDTAEHRRLNQVMWAAAKGDDPRQVYKAAQAFQKHADAEGDLEAHYNAWMCGIAYNLDHMNIRDAYHIAVSLKNDLKNITGGKEEQYLGPSMMGQVYNICGNDSGAIREFKEAISLIKGTRYEKTTLCSLYMGLAHLTLTSNPDRSLHWIEEDIKVLDQHHDWPAYHKGLSAAYAIKSIIYFKKKDYDQSRYWYEQSTSVSKDDQDGYSGIFMSYANIYHKALDGHVEEALADADDVQSVKERYLIKCDLYLYAGEKDQAFKTQRELMQLNDSVTGTMMAENIEQSEQEIRMMRSQQKTTRLAITILVISIILAILFIALLFVIIHIRKRYNQRLKEKNKELRAAYRQVTAADEMKMEFIRSVSHEIRTPLNIINGFSQVLTSEANDFDANERHQIATTIGDSTRQITSLVNKMLALANNSTKDLLKEAENTDVLNICHCVIESMPKVDPEKIKVSFEDQTEGWDHIIFTHSDCLLQMLDDLLENATKFTEQGYIQLRLSKDDKTCRFTVEDTGCGISDEDAKHIFERFMKVDEFKEGLGLGLAYCHETTQKLGGTLELDTTYKQGCRFILSLPIQHLTS